MMMVNSQSIIALNWKWLKVLLTRFLRFDFRVFALTSIFPSLIQLTQRLGAVHSQQVDVIQRNLTPSLAIPPLDSFSSLVESRKISFVMFIDYFLMLLLGTHRSLLMIFLNF